MDKWLQFLEGQGARNGGEPGALDFNSANSAAEGRPAGFLAPLADLGLIALSGEDAASFLHNQITNDVEHLAHDQARLAGYCSPKGRLLATFLMWKTGDTIFLQLPREILPAIQKRLQMYVLRAKAKLADASDAHTALGIVGDAATAVLAKHFPHLPATPYAKTDSDAGSLLRLADAGGQPRYQWIVPADGAERAWLELAAALPPAGPRAWRVSNIRAGIPHIAQATQEQFVPQMINFELIGGVNFKKGCYPGQEIVARSQYLGKLKRRMMLAAVESATAKAGDEVFSIADREQPCGMIVNAERVSENASACLVELKLAALDAGTIHLGGIDGPELRFEALPYELKDPE
ncbi:MAG TPA: folate-binding protein YgfZ [Paucimonas sp.]|nr:folate-binding protein YgfZ [Paucimonas sp.]